MRIPLALAALLAGCSPPLPVGDTGETPDPVNPYTGGYNVGHCDEDPTPTGPSGIISGEFQPDDGPPEHYEWPVYEVGDVVHDWAWPDQHGELVRLYDFCGHHVTLVFGAFW